MTTMQRHVSRRALLAGLVAVPGVALASAAPAAADTASPTGPDPELRRWARRAGDAFDLLVRDFGRGETLAKGLLPAIPERSGDADRAPLHDLLGTHRAALAVEAVDPDLVSRASDRAAELSALIANHRETDPPADRAAGYLPRRAGAQTGEPVLDYADNALVGLMHLAGTDRPTPNAPGADAATRQLALLNVSGWDTDLDRTPSGGVRETSDPDTGTRGALATFLMVRLAAQLTDVTGMTGYLDLAQRGWTWGQHLVSGDGEVHRSVSGSGGVDPTRGGAQQGAAIQAALDLWAATADDAYRRSAVTLAPVAVDLLEPSEVRVGRSRIARPPASPDEGAPLVTALIRLSDATGDDSWRAAAVEYGRSLWLGDRVDGARYRGATTARTLLVQQAGLVRTAAALASHGPLRGY